ncbi:hypothetical protein QKU58_gp014 [Pyramimonas orientalis virus]|uniref:Peptidase C14 caspase domain-containing protein n=1 Tax=Pyramimonas orientalis virus 01B TaxID=3134525 RepID=A0A7M4CEP8_9VIRU|nr:hypothetical protein QKU58_gp014 [Pyramimonas orientalis virus]QOI90152.1 hypothetical protein HWQ62_00014 [Pyramimonas orientalis virus]
MGVITNDSIKGCLAKFRSETRVIFIVDCCHSGTMGDLKYRYSCMNKMYIDFIEENTQYASIVMLSCCMDRQCSSSAWDRNGLQMCSRAMSTYLIQALNENKHLNTNMFTLLNCVRDKLYENGLKQIPQLTCSKLLKKDETIIG